MKTTMAETTIKADKQMIMGIQAFKQATCHDYVDNFSFNTSEYP